MSGALSNQQTMERTYLPFTFKQREKVSVAYFDMEMLEIKEGGDIC